MLVIMCGTRSYLCQGIHINVMDSVYIHVCMYVGEWGAKIKPNKIIMSNTYMDR